MPMSCWCDDSGDELDWYWQRPEDYTTLNTSKRKRCSSCRGLINVGAVCLRFDRYRHPRNDIELRIYGDDEIFEITLAPMWLCETCADLWWSLEELGFVCVNPDEDIPALVREYAEEYGPTRVVR